MTEASRSYARLRLPPTGPLTAALAAVAVGVFALLWIGDPFNLWGHLRFFPTLDALLSGDEPWRWITPSLLHLGVMHLAFNLIWWWDLGGAIERYHGKLRLVGLFLVLNVIANLAQFFASGANFGGLSGVVYGVLGYLWAHARCRGVPSIQLNPVVMNLMLLWMLLCFTGIVGPVANAAHLGGLLAGMCLGVVWGWLDRAR